MIKLHIKLYNNFNKSFYRIFKHNFPIIISKNDNNLKLVDSEEKEKIKFKANKKYEELLNEFIKVLEKNTSKENLKAMYKNIKDVSIKEDYLIMAVNYCGQNIVLILRPLFPKKDIKFLLGGRYISKSNKILTFSNLEKRIIPKIFNDKKIENTYDVFSKEVVFHELLHMSSTINGVCGFYNNNIGFGLNEGYTELLTKRYFNEERLKGTYSYEYYSFIARIIEIVLGTEKMQEYYFNANLKGLVDDLSNHLEINQVKQLLLAIDTNDRKSINENLTELVNSQINRLPQESMIELNNLLTNVVDYYKKETGKTR